MNRAYFARRFAMALFAIGVAVVLNFLLIHLMPGDPAHRFYADPRVPPEVKEEMSGSSAWTNPSGPSSSFISATYSGGN